MKILNKLLKRVSKTDETSLITGSPLFQLREHDLPNEALACVGIVGACISRYIRAFMDASIVSGNDRVRDITTNLLTDCVYDLMIHGNAYIYFRINRGRISFYRANPRHITVEGMGGNWTYTMTINHPTKAETRRVDEQRVLHFRLATDPDRIWEGVSFIDMAKHSVVSLYHLEKGYVEELSTSRAYIIPIPVSSLGTSEVAEEARRIIDQAGEDIKKAQGKAIMLATTAGNLGISASSVYDASDGMRGTRKDWVASRIGANPPNVLTTIRDQLEQSILHAFGIPNQLAQAAGKGLADAYRQFLCCSVMPIARMIENEVKSKLEVDDFEIQLKDYVTADFKDRMKSITLASKEGVSTDVMNMEVK